MTSVLIIEDEGDFGRALAMTLVNAGFEVNLVSSAAEARLSLARGHVHLVCADMALEGGLAAAAAATHRQGNPGIPLIAMATKDNVAVRRRSEQYNAAAFLVKPFVPSRFAEMVTALLREAESGPAADTSRPSVMMYSHDTIGLGHMRRNSAIAAEVADAMPSCSVLMTVGCPAGVVFDLDPGVDVVKLPSLAKAARDIWRPSSLRVSSGMARSLRMGILERTATELRPDVLLVDHEPGGVWSELLPTLKTLRESGGTEVILGLRDILDDPDRVKTGWRERGVTDLIGEYYDHILVYGDERLYPSSNLYGLEELAPGRVHYCGYVTTVAPPGTANPPPAGGGGILVSGGGGRDAFPVLAAALEGLGRLPSGSRPAMILVAGPLMDHELFETLQQRASDLGALVLRSTPDIPGMLRRADLFVSMAGYNSLTEAMAVGCPTLVIPRVGPSSEQRIRAGMLAERGLVETLSIGDATPDVLARRFARLGGTRQPRPVIPSLNGVEVAGSFITDILSAKHPQLPVKTVE
ncbi:MAG TPA: response regulator, partial [Thermohalobaculum sp.]|nr:response regulator [Thermohalobaculum sp.]